MQPLFVEDNRWKKFYRICCDWYKTPYRHLQGVKNRGADCSQFIAQVLFEFGVFTKVEYEWYAPDWYVHSDDEVILRHWEHHCNNHWNDDYGIIELDPMIALADNGFMRGDIMGFATYSKGLTNHAAIYLNKEEMLNSINRRGVCIMSFGHFWQRKMTKLFRLMVK